MYTRDTHKCVYEIGFTSIVLRRVMGKLKLLKHTGDHTFTSATRKTGL
jgi:hypothetical protein